MVSYIVNIAHLSMKENIFVLKCIFLFQTDFVLSLHDFVCNNSNY